MRTTNGRENVVNSLKNERIVVARSATGNDAATANHVSNRVRGDLTEVGARASVAPVGRAGALELFEAGQLQPVNAIAAAGAVSSARASSTATIGTLRQDRDPLELEAAEQRRWLTWLCPPFVIQALSVGLVFATGKEWWLALGVASLFATVLVLIRLILSSDTNTLPDSATSHLIERADLVAAVTGLVGAPR
jgi:hypothetical protein